MTDARGQRGKYAEGEVKKYLTLIDGIHLNFDFERLSDARSAGGRGAKKVVGDYSFFSPKIFGTLEVKEIAHDFRLPAANLTQLPKLRKRMLAGGHCYVVVYHTKSKRWRCIRAQSMELKTTGSWDLREYSDYATLVEALPPALLGA